MIASSSTGSSFTGLAGYLLGDESRVGWVEGVNLYERTDGERTLRDAAGRIAAEMRDQAAESARVKAPVYHVALAFDPDDRPTEDELREAARRTLRDLGLQDHQALVVRHTDQRHAHVHLMVNRVGPDGRAWSTSHERRRLRASVEAQERELGVRWTGRNAAVIRTDTPQNDPTRAPGRGFAADVRRQALGDFEKATGWGDLAARLEAKGLRVEQRGRGGVVTDGKREAKLSSVSRSVSLSKLEARFGPRRGQGRSRTAERPTRRPVARSFAASRRASGRVLRPSVATAAWGASRLARSIDMDGERGADERIARATARSARNRAARGAVGVVREAVFPLAGRSVAERSLGTRATHRDVRPGGRIERLAALVTERMRLHRLEAEWGAVLGVRTRAQEATTTQITTLQNRAARAREAFERALSRVYADPKSASRAFVRDTERNGVTAASEKMASSPESFSRLKVAKPERPQGLRGVLHGLRPPSTDLARSGAGEAARAGAAYARATGEHLAATRQSGTPGRGASRGLWVRASERREARVRGALFSTRGGGGPEKATRQLDSRIGRAFERVGRVPFTRSAAERSSPPSRLLSARQTARVNQAMAVRLGATGMDIALSAVRSIGRGLGR